jgi:hypothetical protein
MPPASGGTSTTSVAEPSLSPDSKSCDSSAPDLRDSEARPEATAPRLPSPPLHARSRREAGGATRRIRLDSGAESRHGAAIDGPRRGACSQGGVVVVAPQHCDDHRRDHQHVLGHERRCWMGRRPASRAQSRCLWGRPLRPPFPRCVAWSGPGSGGQDLALLDTRFWPAGRSRNCPKPMRSRGKRPTRGSPTDATR